MQLILVAALLFASFFLVTERVHVCEGEECPICAMLEVTQKNLLGALPDVIPAMVVFLVVVLALCIVSHDLWDTADTPVSRKVRLDR